MGSTNEVARQPIAGYHLARLDRQRAAFEVAELGQRDFRPADLRRTLMPLSRCMRGDHGLAHARQSGAETVCADALRRHTGAFQQEMELVG
jgi:hypothetical protein